MLLRLPLEEQLTVLLALVRSTMWVSSLLQSCLLCDKLLHCWGEICTDWAGEK